MTNSNTTADILDRLFATIESRKGSEPHESYTASLLASAPEKPVRKLAEETTELVIEAMRDDKAAMVQESADLLYHLLVVWAGANIDPRDVYAALEARQSQSGHEEKASRKG